jgi:hypothetical protein
VLVGAVLDMFAGCPLTARVCEKRFDNVEHFTGFNRLPVLNPQIHGVG